MANKQYNTNTGRLTLTLAQTFENVFELTLENQAPQKEPRLFEKVILDAVDSALNVLGESGKHVFYQYLTDNFGATREQIPNAVTEFAKALEIIFGEAAILIEIKMMAALHERVPGFNFAAGYGDLCFVDYVEALRLFL
jgi:hypothetical protein